jgi:hypothetical protein
MPNSPSVSGILAYRGPDEGQWHYYQWHYYESSLLSTNKVDRVQQARQVTDHFYVPWGSPPAGQCGLSKINYGNY